jgi:hypothetical protein
MQPVDLRRLAATEKDATIVTGDHEFKNVEHLVNIEWIN